MVRGADLAKFTRQTIYEELSRDVVTRLKQQVLDTLGVALGAGESEPVRVIQKSLSEEAGPASLWGPDTTASLPDATLYNTARLSSLNYSDSFLVPGDTPHPSETLPAVIAAGESTQATGKELLVSAGVAYEILAGLARAAPLRERGWDPVTQANLAAVAGVSRVLGFDLETTQHALALSGTCHNALRVPRTGEVSMWRDVLAAEVARSAVSSAILAREGMEGPLDFMEGKHGWKQVISGDFDLDFTSCERVRNVFIRKYPTHTYAQSAVDLLLELMKDRSLSSGQLESIQLETFHDAKETLGGGDTSPYDVSTRGDAEQSLPYILAVAALDETVTAEQFQPDRIQSSDVQDFMQRVTVSEQPELTDRHRRGELPARVTLTTDDNRTPSRETADLEGHPDQPMDWNQIETKFRSLTEGVLPVSVQGEIVHAVKNLEDIRVSELTRLLHESSGK